MGRVKTYELFCRKEVGMVLDSLVSLAFSRPGMVCWRDFTLKNDLLFLQDLLSSWILGRPNCPCSVFLLVLQTSCNRYRVSPLDAFFV